MDPQSKQLLADAVKRSAWDPAYFLRFFLPHWFPSTIPPVHLGLIALSTRKVRFLDNYPDAHDFLLTHFHYEPDRNDPLAKPEPVFVKNAEGHICMNDPRAHLNEIIPRGYSKTTLCKGLSLYDLVTDPSMFIVFISESSTHSEAQLGDVKAELETNERIRAAYGDLTATRSDPEKWSAKEIQLTSGSVLMAKGRGGQVRGMTRNGRRPNKIVLDDVEDDDSVASDTQRQKTLSWFYSSVVPAGQVMEGAEGEDWAQQPLQIINLGTLLAAECLVMSLTRDDDFRTVRFGAVVTNPDNSEEMLWEYKMSYALYNRKRETFRKVGQLDKFVREYDSAIRVSDENIFPNQFVYQLTTRADLVAVAQALDPAISDSKKACDAAIIVAGRRASDGALWLLDEWGGIGKTPTEKLEAMFDMHLRWNTTHNGIEAVQYQAALLHIAKEMMAKRKLFFHITPIRPGSKETKPARIQGMLSPRYKMGYLRHLRPLPKYESNIADWPNGKVDYADAATMALELLGETTGLLMEGALEPEEPLPTNPIPEVYLTAGNYIINSRSRNLHRSGRYG